MKNNHNLIVPARHRLPAMLWVLAALICLPLCASTTVSITYNYDLAGQLASVHYGPTHLITYTYDDSGNLIQRVARTAAPEPTVTNAPVPVPITWFESYGIMHNPEAANLADLDNDGADTWKEYVMDTNPTNTQSILTFEPATTTAPAGHILKWHASPNRLYTILWGTNLFFGVTNILVNQLQPLGYGIMEYTDAIHQTDPFIVYRIRVDLP